ncbi:MAG: methyltransferase family protein [Candidatus Thorarchaeota archaeon]
MELFPKFELGWINGWIFLLSFYAIFGIFLLTCSKQVISRLYDESGWTKFQKTSTILAKICGLIHVILVTFTPVNLDSIEFIIGIFIFLIGVIGFLIALQNFKNAPLDKPINSGLYHISRNPQMVMLYIVSIGSSILIGSWTAIIIVSFTMIFSHFRILGEEKRLTEQYGMSYLEFKKKVPRYFIFF